MISLRADNRVLVQNAKFSYLIDNYSSNVGSLVVANTEPYTETNGPILIGEIGQTDAEVLKISSISDKTISLCDINLIPVNTNYSHPESTKVIALAYDQIRFFWTAATGTIADENPVFNDSTPLTSWEALDPSSFYSTYDDPDNSSGFGWFMYRNSTTGETSLESNPIPYVGFTLNTVQQVFADFDSLLNVNELKLVSINDKFAWLNEALAIVKNKLNLSNVEYTVSTPQTLTTTSGVAEYILPDDFSDIVEFTEQGGTPVDFLTVSKVLTNNGSNPTTTRHYIRGRYIGLTPTPGATGTTYYYTYRAKASRVISLSTYLDLPDNAFFCLKDYMMFRCCQKFTNPMATAYYQNFKNMLDLYIQASVKRNANLDTWEIASNANT